MNSVQLKSEGALDLKKNRSISRKSDKGKFQRNQNNTVISLISESLKKYFIYRHCSFQEYLISSDFRKKIKTDKENYEKIILPNKMNSSNEFLNKQYICLGTYPDVEKNLKRKGWEKTTREKNPNVTFIWTLKTVDVNFNNLKTHQIPNHFKLNGSLTRKSGLCKNIRNLYFKGINPDNFYPRCYDLTDKNDLNDFFQDFFFTKALSILKQFSSDENNSFNFTENVIKTSLDFVQKNYKLLTCEYTPKDKNNEIYKLMEDSEWDIISGEESINNFRINSNESINNNLKNDILTKIYGAKPNKVKLPSLIKNKKMNTLPVNSKLNKIQIDNNNNIIASREKYLPIINPLLKKLSEKLPQYKLNGIRNIWVLKPSTLSRGRGIQCINNLKSVFDCLNQENINGLVIQKYIENPLLIYGKKFDIRQWVLVTSIKPLTIWMWDDPYLRFSAEEYNIDNFSNIYSHLTNNCVAKYSKKYNSNNKIEGDMWDVPQFQIYLKETYGKDLWPKIKEQILNIVLCSFDSVKNEIKYRENSFELFGLDVMFDNDLNAYLIEVNASPSMDYSTKITSRLVPEMISSLIDIIIDKKFNESKVGKWIKVFNDKKKIDLHNIPNKSNLY